MPTLNSQMADRLAQADAFHFFGSIFIIAFIFLVFRTLEPVSKAIWALIRKLSKGKDNSVAPEPSEEDKKSKEDDYLGLGQHAGSEEARREEEKRQSMADLVLTGIPEFDIAVRSKLLVGPATYRMQVREDPRW